MRKQRLCCWRKEPVNICVSFLLDQRVEELINAFKGMASFGQTPTTPHEIPQWLIKFIAAAYGCSAKCTDFTTARITLFNALIKKKADNDINRFLPPTAQALLPHLQRAALQTFISRQCYTPPPINVPDATNFGWQREGSICFQSPCPNATVLTLITSSQARQTRTIRHLQMMKRQVVRKVIQRHLLTSLRTVTVISKEDFVRFDDCS